MLQMILWSISLTTNFIFINTNHPLAMGMTLLMQTILISLFTGLLTKTFWFSYIMFLIFVGGMLVLFIYVTSLASNEMFSFSLKLMILFISTTFLSIFLLFFLDNNLLNMMNNTDMTEMTFNFSFNSENTLSLNKLYNYPNNLITILLMNYLLFTLIAVIKITNMFIGPLRSMN